MAFWNSISQKASETTVKAMQKAKDMSDIAKLNSVISEEETKINNIYYQIGKLYIAIHPDDYEEEFTGMIASLAEAESKLSNYRQQVQDIKGVVRCPQCGAEVQLGSAFCSSCGSSMPKVQTMNMEEMEKCGNCGEMMKKGTRFCTSCGKPMMQVVGIDNASEGESAYYKKSKCSKCGHELKESARFCVFCGNPVVQIEETESTFAMKETNAYSRICPNCGAEIGDENAFCTECGTKV